ncbi:MAG: DUF1554 domain-containing protein [Deltaproteobacteria bacterium]
MSGGRTFCDRGRCIAAPFCGDGSINGNEVCDDGSLKSTDVGSCNPECTGFYERRSIRLTTQNYGTDLGGIGGADAICSREFGAGWKALLVGSTRRATVTPFVGDGQRDWVIRKYAHYVNAQGQLVWRTDGVALLATDGARHQNVLSPLFQAITFANPLAWSGYNADWTTQPDTGTTGTCLGWTSAEISLNLTATAITAGGFTTADPRQFTVTTTCGTTSVRILCVEQ